MTTLGKVWYSLVFSCALIGTHAFGYALCVYLLLEETSVAGLVAPLCFFASTYAFDRVVRFDPVADSFNHPWRVAFAERYGSWFQVAAPATFLLGLLLCLVTQPATALLYLAPVLAMPLYGGRLLPANWRYRRVKDVPGAKSLYTCSIWALLCVVLPTLMAGRALSPLTGLLATWVFLRTLANGLAADSYDTEGDLEEGAVTIATLLGRDRGYQVAQGVNVLAGLVLPAAWALELVPGFVHLVNVASVGSVAAFTWASQHRTPQGMDRWYFYASEGEGLAVGAAMLAVSLT